MDELPATDVDPGVREARPERVGKEDEVARLQLVHAHRLTHLDLLEHVVGNVHAERVLDYELGESGAIEGVGAFTGIGIRIPHVLLREAGDMLAAGGGGAVIAGASATIADVTAIITAAIFVPAALLELNGGCARLPGD